MSIVNLFLACFVVFLIGLFAFELSRYLLARDELKTNVEVAALSCQTTLVSSGDPTSATNQTSAQNAGLQLFQQNSILGQPMTQATIASSPGQLNPAPSQAQINFQFLDPITKQPVNQTGAGVSGINNSASSGTLIQAIGAYSYAPAFGQFIGLGNAQFTFQVSALSGVPKIDLMVLLDISGGMDNDTSVSTFQRYQTPTGTNWMVNPNPANGNSPAQGPIYTLMCGNTGNPPDLGAIYPNQYDQIANSNCVTVQYSEMPGLPGSNHLAGAGPGTPPGNWCPGSSNPTGFLPSLPGSASDNLTPGKKYQQAIALLNEPLTKGIKGPHYLERCLKNIALNTSHNLNTSHKLIARLPVKDRSYLVGAADQSLLKLCHEIASGQNVNKISLAPRTDLSQLDAKLDERLSTISFAPQFYALPVPVNNAINPATPTNPTNPAAPPDQYTGADGQGYYANSRQPGAGADTGAAVLPTISGYCTPEPTSFGAAAPTVFTGAFVTGVLGAVSADGSMSFPFSAVAIEAMLGDLQSATNAAQAGIDTSALNVTPQSGWFAFYYNTARQYLQPYMSVVNSLIGFLNELAIVSDVHYGFIAFNDSVGANAGSMSAPINNVSNYFNSPTMNPDGTISVSNTYPLPNILLDASTSNQSAIINVLPNLSVWGNRNVTQALQTAYNELQSNGRPGANQAIVLVVSGIPNGTDTAANAIAQATTIGQAGIPVYVVCAAIQTSDDSDDDNAYTDTGGSSGGVAGVSAHGAKYYRVDFANPGSANSELISVFGNIARRLVSIVQNNSTY